MNRETLNGQGNFRWTGKLQLIKKTLDEHWTEKLQMNNETLDGQGNFR